MSLLGVFNKNNEELSSSKRISFYKLLFRKNIGDTTIVSILRNEVASNPTGSMFLVYKRFLDRIYSGEPTVSILKDYFPQAEFIELKKGLDGGNFEASCGRALFLAMKETKKYESCIYFTLGVVVTFFLLFMLY